MHMEDAKGGKCFRRWKWSHVATFPECRVSVVGMLEGTWSTPLTQHIARKETRSGAISTTKKTNYLPVRLCSHGCSFARFFHRGFLFSSGFGDVSSHASGATKEPNRSNDWTKTARFFPKYSSQARTPPSPTEIEDQTKTGVTAKRRAGLAKYGKGAEEKAISSPKKLSPSRAEFGNGEIGPAANEMRSTTPQSTDEWAPGLWRQSHGGSTNHKSWTQRAGRKRRRGRSWSWRREGSMDNGRHNNNKAQLLFGVPFI